MPGATVVPGGIYLPTAPRGCYAVEFGTVLKAGPAVVNVAPEVGQCRDRLQAATAVGTG